MSSYGSQTESTYYYDPFDLSQPSTYQFPQQHSPPKNGSYSGGGVFLHPQQQQQCQPQPSQGTLQPYQRPQYAVHHQQPSYDRQPSPHHSYHSPPSRKYDEDRYEEDRDLEHRPTFGDTLSLMWKTVSGAITRKRR